MLELWRELPCTSIGDLCKKKVVHSLQMNCFDPNAEAGRRRDFLKGGGGGGRSFYIIWYFSEGFILHRSLH